MKTWDIARLDVATGRPEVLHTVPQGRAIAIHLDEGGTLDEHQVHEAAWLFVSAGLLGVGGHEGGDRQLGPGSLAAFDPHERHRVWAIEESRMLLLLTPWPAPDRQD